MPGGLRKNKRAKYLGRVREQLWLAAVLLLLLVQVLRNSPLKYSYVPEKLPPPPSAHATGEEESSNFEGFWEGDPHNCHAVDNICYAKDLERWFYFRQHGGSGGTRHHQPSLDLHGVRGVHFDVSSVTARPTLSELKDAPMAACGLSKVDNHVVIQTPYNDMIGEFYTRSLVPLGQMMKAYPTDPNNLQFYVHMMKGSGKIYDGHKLFLSAFSNNEAMSWLDMFAKNNEEGDGIGGNNHTGCQCYRRFVMCGYSIEERNGTICKLSMDKLGLPTVAQPLCQHGIDLSMMSKMDKHELNATLSKAGMDNANRSKVAKFVNERSGNVAIHQPSMASSVSLNLLPRYAFDGKNDTRWASEASANQTLTVDLTSSYSVWKVVIMWEQACAKDYDIQVSTDGAHWATVWSKADGYGGMGTVESLLSTHVTCRYVRMQGNALATGWGYSIYEMEVYGRKIPTEKVGTASPPADFGERPRTLKVSGGIFFTRSMSSNESSAPTQSSIHNNLRLDISMTLDRKHPTLLTDVETNRRAMIEGAVQKFQGKKIKYDVKDNWTIIGCTQRKKRRSWLNLEDTIVHCNTQYIVHRIICVEVNVEKTNSPLDQLILHRSLDVLIGIHGAQLTQGVLLPSNGTVIELLPWTPTEKANVFGTGSGLYGGWVSRIDCPTPLGIIYNGTQLNHYGFRLYRDSIPLCENVANVVIKTNKTKYRDSNWKELEPHIQEAASTLGYNETSWSKGLDWSESLVWSALSLHQQISAVRLGMFTNTLEDCFKSKGVNWDTRDFIVNRTMIDSFIWKILLRRGTTDYCNDLRENGENGKFVLYNIWCRKSSNSSNVSLQHYYQKAH